MVQIDLEPPEKNKKFSINWPADLIRRIDAIKEKTGVTRTAVILTACTQYVQMMEDYYGAEEMGDADIDEKDELKEVLIDLLSDPDIMDAVEARRRHRRDDN